MTSRFAVGFDFDHTLGLDNKLERTVALEMLATYAREHGASYDAAAADASVDDLLSSYRIGTLTPEVALAGFLERFVPVPGSAVMDAALKFREVVTERASAFVTAVDGAHEAIAELGRMGVAIALLTNGWSPFQEEKARIFGFPGPVFVSERIGMRKPAREAFAYLVTAFERAPVDIFYVGDDPLADCVGARDAGMQSVWFDWEHKTYPADLAAPHYTIQRLQELPAILQGRD